MNIKPLFDRIIVEEEKTEYSNKGIFLGSETKDNPKIGKVMFIGEGNELENGKKCTMFVKPGDKVLYNKFSGVEAFINKKQFFIIRQTDILAIID